MGEPGAAGMPEPCMTAAAHLAARLARDIGDQPAAAWVHAPAMARHAAQAGLIEPPPDPSGDPAGAIQAGIGQLAAAHPALASLADPAVNPLWAVPLPAASAAGLAALWRDADLVPLPERLDGYLIGDLYQALSAEARAARALCQTPRFVTSLLLDLSYEQAAREWGHQDLRIIDPACGTGHILIETFIRACPALFRQGPPGQGIAGAVEAALRAVHGVDIDPYAALIARYRLLAAACHWGGRRLRLRDLPRDLPVQVAAADSLLAEDEPLLERGRYHAVIANPPYITCKDPAQREAIRRRYREVCSGRYPLAVPFEVLMHELCVRGGWVARLTANSFMKREFGKRLIESYLPRIDLEWIIDTSGAYIPGHGTPTVILASRNQPPSGPAVRAVQGVRGEPARPADPARGVVWCAIAAKVRERLALERFARAAAAAGTPSAVASPGQGRPETAAAEPHAAVTPGGVTVFRAPAAPAATTAGAGRA